MRARTSRARAAADLYGDTVEEIDASCGTIFKTLKWSSGLSV